LVDSTTVVRVRATPAMPLSVPIICSSALTSATRTFTT
jgi:hypothetical protein